ncbi:MAG: bestrophin family protein [Bryobacteraceae bacterium]
MIVSDHLPWIRIWPQISRKLGVFLIYDLMISVLYVFVGVKFIAQPSLPLGMVGAALSIFLAFRTNSAYDRWWEARILWGGLVNYSRSFARQALTLVRIPDDPDEERRVQQRLVMLQIAFVHALRCHLRRQNSLPELKNFLDSDTVEGLRHHRNVPAAILGKMGAELRYAYERGWLDSYRWMSMDQSLTELTNIQGACERIKNTPLPRQYDYFPRLLVTIFCLMLPIGLVEGLGMLTPIASTFLGFIFVALDSIGRNIETPFENSVHDTPMTNLSRAIEINLRQHMGDNDNLPVEVQPVAGFMY